MVWHFCQAQDAEKLKILNLSRGLFLKIATESDCDSLLERASTPSLANTCKRISNMMTCIVKCIDFSNYLAYLNSCFSLECLTTL